MRLSRRFIGAALGLGLLSLLLLGSPGCGCGDDDLRPPGDERPTPCCCDFEWLPPTVAIGRDVNVSIENASITLGASVAPGSFAAVDPRTPEPFTICVDQTHALTDSLEIVFSDSVTNLEYGRAALYYTQRCTPEIEPLSAELNLVSTDCGGETLQCCCEFEWLPGPNMAGDVTVTAENASAGLNPILTPGAITGVVPGTIELIDVCVDADHPIGAQMDLVVRQQGSGALIGQVQLVYDEQCTPTVVPSSAVPSLAITSTECGGEPLLCCCDIEWLSPTSPPFAQIDATLENVDPSLQVATVTPPTALNLPAGNAQIFTVCVNPGHGLGATLDLVLREPTGLEIARLPLRYSDVCLPTPGNPTGQGFWTVLCLDPVDVKPGR